jgi:hypothetical protein
MISRTLVLLLFVGVGVPGCKSTSRQRPPDAGASPAAVDVVEPGGNDNPFDAQEPAPDGQSQSASASPVADAGRSADAPAPSAADAGRSASGAGSVGAASARPSTADSGLTRPQVLGGGAVAVKRFVLCKSVAEREPVLATQRFRRARTESIWAFIEAENTTGEDKKLSVTFESLDRPGTRTPAVELTVGQGRRFRTWAHVTAWRPVGRYEAVVRDVAGTVVARGGFEVVE